jgi:hypothetical protein
MDAKALLANKIRESGDWTQTPSSIASNNAPHGSGKKFPLTSDSGGMGNDDPSFIFVYRYTTRALAPRYLKDS